jgi:hypothetical protein
MKNKKGITAASLGRQSSEAIRRGHAGRGAVSGAFTGVYFSGFQADACRHRDHEEAPASRPGARSEDGAGSLETPW